MTTHKIWKNLEEFERHGDMNKDDPNDTTVSYGVQKNYRCYQLGELVVMFDQYPDEFRVPDAKPTPGIDPTTRLGYTNEFTLDSIRELKRVLTTATSRPRNYNLRGLPEVIDRKLQAFIAEGQRIRRMKASFDSFPWPNYILPGYSFMVIGCDFGKVQEIHGHMNPEHE